MTGAWDTLLYGAIEGIAIGVCYTMVEKYMLSKKESPKNPCSYLKQGDRQCLSTGTHDVTHCLIPSPPGSKVQNKYVRFKLCDFHYKKFIATQTKQKEVTKLGTNPSPEVKKETETKQLPQVRTETPLPTESPKLTSPNIEVKDAHSITQTEAKKNETKS
jgi:hypothetical protein